MEVGEIYRRNNSHRGVHVYCIIVTSINAKYIKIRRELLDGSLVHENVEWPVEEFLQFFEKT